jgi:hypothetical protein
MHKRANNEVASPTSSATTSNPAAPTAQDQTANNPGNSTQNATNDLNAKQDDQTVYRNGYSDGFADASKKAGSQPSTSTTEPARTERNRANTGNEVARNTRTADSRRPVYYDYSQQPKRSFWDKHRDKVTVAGGTMGGAILGALVGGHKGAAIGALAGGGGSALYTYKMRKRNNNSDY